MLSKSSGCQLVAVVLCLGLYHRCFGLDRSDNACLCRALILGFVFIAAAFIDMATYTLPNLLTLGGRCWDCCCREAISLTLLKAV